MFLCVSSYSESIFHSGAVVSFQNVLSNPVLELIVRPGENVTLTVIPQLVFISFGSEIVLMKISQHLYWKPLKPILKRKFITHMKENIYIIILNGTYLHWKKPSVEPIKNNKGNGSHLYYIT